MAMQEVMQFFNHSQYSIHVHTYNQLPILLKNKYASKHGLYGL